MRTLATRARALIVILLIGSAVLFVVGTTLERSESPHDETAAETSPEAASGEESEGEETEGEQAESPGEERIFGIDPDSPWTVALAVVASLALAAGVALIGSTPVLVVTGLFALAFAAGDLRELVRQLDESNAGVALIAALLVVAHLLVAVLAASLLRRGRGPTETVRQPAG